MGNLSLYSHPFAASEPDQRARAGVLELMRSSVPGQWTDNRWEQSRHFLGVVYVAIKAIMDAMSGATVQVVRERKQKKNPTTFGPGGAVSKAMPAPGAGIRDEDYVPAPNDHPLSRLVDSPNPTETIGDVLEYMALQHRLTGIAPLWTVPLKKWYEQGEIRSEEIYALPTALTVPQPASYQYPEGSYRLQPYYATGGMAYLPGRAGGISGALLDAREVPRLIDKHPFTKWDGYSPLTGCGVQLDILEAIDQSRWSAMQHGTTPDMLVTGGGLTEETLKSVTSKWEDKHGGARNSRKIAFLFAPDPDAKINVSAPYATAREMDYTSSWDQVVGFALAVFGVPKSVSGLATSTTYSELYAALKQFYTLTLRPFMRRMAEFLTRSLAKAWWTRPGEYRFQIDAAPIDDQELFEKQFGTDLQHELRTYNEARAARNLSPVEGGDVPPSIYMAMLQAKLQPQQQAAAMQAGGGDMAGMLGGEPGQSDGQIPAGDATGEELAATADDSAGDGGAVGESVMQGVLAQLGIAGGDEPGMVQKAIAAPGRKEGERWQGPSGRWFTLKNGRTVPSAAPGGGATPAPAGGDRVAAFANAAQARASQSAGPKPLGFQGDEQPAGEAKPAAVLPEPLGFKQGDEAVGQSSGSSKPLPSAYGLADEVPPDDQIPTFTTPAQVDVSQPDAPAGLRDFAGDDGVAKIGGEPAKQGESKPRGSLPERPRSPNAQEIYQAKYGPGGSLAHLFDDDVPPAVQAAHDAPVPDAVKAHADTPEGHAVLSKVDSWADAQAEKHADRVAKHLGCSRQQAKAALGILVRRMANRAATEGRGVRANLTFGGKKLGLRVGAKQGQPAAPTNKTTSAGAVPQPSNPSAAGSRPPSAPGASGKPQAIPVGPNRSSIPAPVRTAASRVANAARDVGRDVVGDFQNAYEAAKDQSRDAVNWIKRRFGVNKSFVPPFGYCPECGSPGLEVNEDEIASCCHGHDYAECEASWGPVAKAEPAPMSTLSGPDGGFLVTPRCRKRGRKRLRRTTNAVIKSLMESDRYA